MVPVMERALHTYVSNNDSKLNHILGTGNSEMNKTQPQRIPGLVGKTEKQSNEYQLQTTTTLIL